MSMKNMAVMFGAMAFMRRIDQEEPLVLMYSRVFYIGYIIVTALIYILLHLRILARRDTSLITVPAAAKAPSFADALAAAKGEEPKERPESGDADSDAAEEETSKLTEKPDGEADGDENPQTEDTSKDDDAPKEEVMTVMEYDLRHLATARKSWITNACLLAAIHYKMESVSPLIMSSLMGLMRLLSDDPLVQIHIRGAPAVGPLKRPFKPEKNPLAALLKDMAPKPDESKDSAAASPADGVVARPAVVAEPEEDLHDDGESEEDDSPPPAIADLRDDHIKSDFDDDDAEGVAESKKSQ